MPSCELQMTIRIMFTSILCKQFQPAQNLARESSERQSGDFYRRNPRPHAVRCWIALNEDFHGPVGDGDGVLYGQGWSFPRSAGKRWKLPHSRHKSFAR